MTHSRSLASFIPKKVFDYWHTTEEGAGIISNGETFMNVGRVGTEIWKLVNGKNNIQEIAEHIAYQFNQNIQVVESDIGKFFSDIAESKMVVLDSGPLYKLGKANKNVKLNWRDSYLTNTTGAVDILLLVPPSPHLETNIVSRIYNASCLGVGYLYSLVQANFNLKIGMLDLWSAIFTEQDLDEILAELSPRILALSSMTENAQNGYRIAEKYKKSTSGRGTVVMGGSHVTFRYEDALSHGHVDYCFLGESEKSFCKFISHHFSNDSEDHYEEVPGIAYLRNGRLIITERAETEELEHLPYPQLFPRHVHDKGIIPIMTSRGCPFGCKFCAAGELSGNRYRFRSIDSVIAEMVYQSNIYAVSQFHFLDDTISVIPRRLTEFCEKVRLAPINNCRWVAESRVDILAAHPELALRMKEAGCFGVQVGIEGGTDEKLLEINKKTTLEAIRRAIENCVKVDLKVTGSMVIGLPGETKESCLATLRFASMLQRDYGISIYVGWFVPFPGTIYDRELDEMGCTRRYGHDFDQYSTLSPNIFSPGDHLEDMLNMFHQNFSGMNKSIESAKKAMASLKLDFLKPLEYFKFNGVAFDPIISSSSAPSSQE